MATVRRWRGRPWTAWLLLALLALLGVRGLLGGAQFVLVPSGDVVGVSTRHLAGTPLDDYLVPGAVLLVVLGVAPLVVAAGLYGRRNWAVPGAVLVGLALAAWSVAEGFVIGFGERLQHVNLLYSVVVLGLALAPATRADAEDVLED